MKKTSKFSNSNPDLHLQSDHKRTKWLIQSVIILLLLSITTATIMVFHFMKNTSEPQPPNAEKLVSPEVITDQLNQQTGNTPEGFKNELKGPKPSRFARATENPVVITQRHPKNIQEIIGHLQDGDETGRKRPRPDPFFSYKPENPSDVNLLAVNSVRFAPPVWADFRNVGAKRRVEENSTSLRSKGSQILRSEIILPRSEVDGVPRTFVRLNVYSKRHKKRNSKVIFPSRK